VSGRIVSSLEQLAETGIPWRAGRCVCVQCVPRHCSDPVSEGNPGLQVP
jgi:hypothetical protein